MKDKTENLTKNNLYWLYLTGGFLILFLPLLFLPPWFTPIGWGKTIVFRLFCSLLVCCFLWQILYKKVQFWEIKRAIKSISPAFWLLIALFLIYLLSTVFSLDPHFSLWGDPIRSGGFINFSFYILFAIFIFLIIQQKDWQKIWDFSIVIGILASIITIFQQFGIYSKFFIPFAVRPGGPVGNPIFLATYLLLLTFPSLSFLFQSKNLAKKIFYLTSILLFLFVVFALTQSRGAYLGIAVGFLWFLFAYPAPEQVRYGASPKKLKKLKISAGIILVLIILSIYFLNIFLKSHLDLYTKIYENIPSPVNNFVDRLLSLFEGPGVEKGRISSWKISFQALKDRPFLGYGPENFMIGFDKYYDPKLPRLLIITPERGGAEWWDRAHNFVFDISVTAGLPTLIIYLSFFGILLWQLQKIKKESQEAALLSHGLQATFLGYLTAIFFSFDWFETYLISFLLIAYSFHLISIANLKEGVNFEEKRNKKTRPAFVYRYKAPIMFLLFLVLIWFFWVFNLKPLKITKELNMAIYYAEEAQIKDCSKALGIVDRISPTNNIIDNYIRTISATEVFRNCADESSAEEISKKAIQLLKKSVEDHPHYLQNWLLVAEYTNILIEEKIKLADNIFLPTEEMLALKSDANDYFEKASQLSPKRQEIFKEWTKTGIITGDYDLAEEKAQKCIDLNPDFGGCYWLMALVQGYLKDSEKLNYYAELAQERDFNIESEEALQQLINLQIRIRDYQGLSESYPKLISITPEKNEKAQLYASLAFVYKELGQKEKAREAALKALELLPEARDIVEEFLRSLEQ